MTEEADISTYWGGATALATEYLSPIDLTSFDTSV